MNKLYTTAILAVLFFGIILVSGCAQQKQTTYGQQDIPPAEQKPAEQTTSQTLDVEIKDFAFTPSEIRIKKGDTVTWTNKDSVPHKVVSDSGNELDSQVISGSVTYSHTFNQVGTFDYHCSIHPSMKAKVIVE